MNAHAKEKKTMIKYIKQYTVHFVYIFCTYARDIVYLINTIFINYYYNLCERQITDLKERFSVVILYIVIMKRHLILH